MMIDAGCKSNSNYIRLFMALSRNHSLCNFKTSAIKTQVVQILYLLCRKSQLLLRYDLSIDCASNWMFERERPTNKMELSKEPKSAIESRSH